MNKQKGILLVVIKLLCQYTFLFIRKFHFYKEKIKISKKNLNFRIKLIFFVLCIV